MRALVTGGQGFVGRFVVADLLQRGYETLAIGRSRAHPGAFTHEIHCGSTRIRAPLPAALEPVLSRDDAPYRSIDILDTEALTQGIRTFRPDLVVHLASGLRGDDAERLVTTNLLGTISLIEAVARAGVELDKLVLGSTGGVYGNPVELPLRESAACHPADLYATTKLAAEHAALILSRKHGIPVVSARMFNLVGPGQEERHLCGHLASTLNAMAMGVTPPTLSVGNTESTRDYIDVRDVATAVHLLAVRGEPGTAYNIASGEETSVHAVIDSFLDLTGLRSTVRLQQNVDRDAGVPRHVAAIDRLRGLGYEAAYPLSRSIADLISYYRNAFEGLKTT